MTIEPVQPNAQTPVTPPANGQTENWEAKYVELSAKIASGEYVAKPTYVGLQQTVEKKEAERLRLAGDLAAATTKVTEYENTLKTVQSTAEQLRAEKERIEAEFGQTKTKLERQQVIMSKFPHLAVFEADNLLPSAPPDQLESVLSTFSTKLGVLQTEAKKEQVAGTSMIPPGKQQVETVTSQGLFEEAAAMAKAGQWKEYNAKMDEYYKSMGPLPETAKK